ncbi:MAG TPA: TIR domain-containing protein [Pyrinomonadaceae bacterium]|jgi:TIR domain-containing protein|nr:TIR domain-containing protein [Pyrinomonadaceae bacterium]
MPSNPKSTTARNGVFISYARSDEKKFADGLRQRLEAEGIPTLARSRRMEGGCDWWLQITRSTGSS